MRHGYLVILHCFGTYVSVLGPFYPSLVGQTLFLNACQRHAKNGSGQVSSMDW